MITVVVLLILAVSIALVVMSKKKQAATQTSAPTTTVNQIDATNFPAQIGTPTTVIPSGAVTKQPTTEEALKNAAKQIAKIFAERYGSYSSDASGDNVRSIEPLATADLWKVLSRRLASDYKGEFVGVTTKVVAANITAYTDSAATVAMNCLRTTTKGDVTDKTNQAVTVKLVRSGDTWLVDDIKWGE